MSGMTPSALSVTLDHGPWTEWRTVQSCQPVYDSVQRGRNGRHGRRRNPLKIMDASMFAG